MGIELPNWLNGIASKYGWEEAARQWETHIEDMKLIREEEERKEAQRWNSDGLPLPSVC